MPKGQQNEHYMGMAGGKKRGLIKTQKNANEEARRKVKKNRYHHIGGGGPGEGFSKVKNNLQQKDVL